MMYLTRGGSVQMPLTSGPWGWPADQIPWPADQLLCRFEPKLRGHVSTREGEGHGDEESQWRTNLLASRPRGLPGRPPLGELPHLLSRWSSPTTL
jgi:hypothetical protein